jgi:predicted nucleic acid-binding protein
MLTKKQACMIHRKFICILDTNVVYPLWIRDLLMWFAYFELYTPKWSKNIFDEWISVMLRKGIEENEALNRVNKMNLAFPDALVINYESLINALELPDLDNRHILAAAIKSNSDLIITNNLKDFPEDYLFGFGIKAKTPDDFFTDIIDLNHDLSVEAFKKLVLNKKNPPFNELEILDIFRINGLKDTVDYLHSLI